MPVSYLGYGLYKSYMRHTCISLSITSLTNYLLDEIQRSNPSTCGWPLGWVFCTVIHSRRKAPNHCLHCDISVLYSCISMAALRGGTHRDVKKSRLHSERLQEFLSEGSAHSLKNIQRLADIFRGRSTTINPWYPGIS